MTLILLLFGLMVACSGESQPLLDNGRATKTNGTSGLGRSGELGVNERGELTLEEEIDEDEAFFDSLGPRENITRVFSNINLDEDAIRDLAERILELKEMKTGKFPISANISMTLIMLKYMAELGEYEVGSRDLGIILKGFLDLAGETLSEPIWDVVRQIKKVRLGNEAGRSFIQIFTKGNGRLIYRIFEKMDGDVLQTVEMNNGEKIYIDPIDTMVEWKETLDFLSKKETFLGFKIKKLNQIHPGIYQNAWHYLERNDLAYPPMTVDVGTAFIRLQSRKVKILKMYTLPGIQTADGSPLPSIVIRGKTGRFKLKTSIDQ